MQLLNPLVAFFICSTQIETGKMGLKIWLLNLLFWYNAFSLHFPKVGGAFVINKRPNEAELAAKIKAWIEDIRKKPLPTICTGLDEEYVAEDEVFLKTVPCHQEKAIKRYVIMLFLALNF